MFDKNMPSVRISGDYENYPHFITHTTIEWLNIFTQEEYFQIIIDSFKYCQKHKGLLLYDYVIMTNHIHHISDSREGNKLSQIISDFKKHTTREINKLLRKDNRKYILNILNNSYYKKKGYKDQIWQRENFPKVIESDDFFEQKISYIYQNPVKAGYVFKPEDWKYSSARNRYLNDSSIITVEEYPR